MTNIHTNFKSIARSHGCAIEFLLLAEGIRLVGIALAIEEVATPTVMPAAADGIMKGGEVLKVVEQGDSRKAIRVLLDNGF